MLLDSQSHIKRSYAYIKKKGPKTGPWGLGEHPLIIRG